MKNKLYLHIGTGKTGTTALQNFFYMNREVLAGKGIVYPEAGLFATAHHPIGASLKRISNAPYKWRSLEKYLGRIVRKKDNVLISAENMWNARVDDIKRLEMLKDFFEVKVVIYLRRQDSYVSSRYNLFAKTSVRVDGIDDYLSKTDKVLNYYKFWFNSQKVG